MENRIGIGMFLENCKAEYTKFEVEMDVRLRLLYVYDLWRCLLFAWSGTQLMQFKSNLHADITFI